MTDSNGFKFMDDPATGVLYYKAEFSTGGIVPAIKLVAELEDYRQDKLSLLKEEFAPPRWQRVLHPLLAEGIEVEQTKTFLNDKEKSYHKLSMLEAHMMNTFRGMYETMPSEGDYVLMQDLSVGRMMSIEPKAYIHFPGGESRRFMGDWPLCVLVEDAEAEMNHRDPVVVHGEWTVDMIGFGADNLGGLDLYHELGSLDVVKRYSRRERMRKRVVPLRMKKK